MKWFKHDTDASIDAKLQELLLDYGASGYGLYWYCVELIAQNVNENNITFELEHDARIIARNLNLSLQETKDMMQKMIDLNLFSFSKNHKLACYALAKRLDQSMTSNPEFRALIKNVKENKVINHDEVMINHDLVMQEEKRREEIRLEEKKEYIAPKVFRFIKPTIDEILQEIISKKYNLDAEAFYSYYESNGWMVGRTKMKSWQSALTTWAKRDNNKAKPTYKKSLAESNREAMDNYERMAKYGSDVIDGVLG